MARASLDLVPTKEPDKDIDFPLEIISGAAEPFVEAYSVTLEPPRHFWYMCFLTCLGTFLAHKLTLDTEINVQPRLYVVLLGKTGKMRKGAAIRKTVEFFDHIPGFHNVKGYGSGEALAASLEEKGQVLVYYDEFQRLIHKSASTGGSLLDVVFELFEMNDFENILRDEKRSIRLSDAYLTMLAASTPERFENVFTSRQADYEFLNRLFLVPGDSKPKDAIPGTIHTKIKTLLREQIKLSFLSAMDGFIKREGQPPNKLIYPIEAEAFQLYEHWYLRQWSKIELGERLDTYALRFMPLLSLNDGKSEIDVETVEKVLKLVNWQGRVRKLYEPIFLSTRSARVHEKIIKILDNQRKKERSDGRLYNDLGGRQWVSRIEYLDALKKLRDYKIISSFPKWNTTYHKLIRV